MAIELPKTKIKAELQDPKYLIVFGKPKIGKSTALAALPNNLIVDLENGYKYIDALKVEAKSLQDLKEIAIAIKEAGCPYKYLTLDTITKLEEIVKPLALKLYLDTPAGSKFTGKDVLDAPMGAGYSKIREAIEVVIDMFQKVVPNIILVCHVKVIDLTGKTGRVLASRSDAIGYLCRDDFSNTILSFNSNDKFVDCGSRPEHLRNKDIVLGEMQDDGTIIYHWERIFPSENQK